MKINIGQVITHIVEIVLPPMTYGKVFYTNMKGTYGNKSFSVYLFFDRSNSYVKVAYKVTSLYEVLDLEKKINLHFAARHDKLWSDFMGNIILNIIQKLGDKTTSNLSIYLPSPKSHIILSGALSINENDQYYEFKQIKKYEIQ